jgi:hypothetical protein
VYSFFFVSISVGHACGHNIITVQGLACALSLKALMEQDLVQGTVVLFGTPAEETTSGKINFVKEGILKDSVDYAMMLVSQCFALDILIYLTFFLFYSILLPRMVFTVECWLWILLM